MIKKITYFTLISVLFFSACNYTQKIRDGKTAYEQKQYSVAQKLLKKEYNKAKSRIEKGKIAFMLAESYTAVNKSDESINWYEIAYNNQYGIEAQRKFAYTLKKAERYKEAAIAFKELGLEIGSPYEYRREIQACKLAEKWKKSKRVEYQTQLADFNSGYADYSPSLYKNNSLVFTSDRKLSTGDDTYNWTGNQFSDLFQVDLENNIVDRFDGVINSENNEGTITFNGNFTETIFTRCFGDKKQDAYCKLLSSKNTAGQWSSPEALPFMDLNVNYGQPSLSEDGRTLYFVAEHPDGWGGTDIYISHKNESDEWADPKLLSRSINTIGNEAFPFVQGDTLYFASDFHPGMGGLDIFKSYRLSSAKSDGAGDWAKALNLKAPINSGGDDFGFIVEKKRNANGEILQSGYFTSTRELGIGNDDIYRFEKRKMPKEEVIQPKEIVYKMTLDVYVLEKIFADIDNPNSDLLGRKPLPGAKVSVQLGKRKQNFTIGEEGFFTLELDEKTDYSFKASQKGYLNQKVDFTSKGIGKDPNNPERKFELEIVMDKIYVNKEIRLENIYYDFEQWFIRESAKPTLDALAQTLQLNPRISIQLGSHTDCRGGNRYNLDLSQRRAQSAVDYLISKGIDGSRLIARGFGENESANDCNCSQCTEAEHQENRRTTFKIIE